MNIQKETIAWNFTVAKKYSFGTFSITLSVMVCDTNMGMSLKAVLLIISLKDIRIIAPTDKMGDFSCELKTWRWGRSWMSLRGCCPSDGGGSETELAKAKIQRVLKEKGQFAADLNYMEMYFFDLFKWFEK